MTHNLTRRGILGGLGGLALTAGAAAALSRPGFRKPVLDSMSRWNDGAQAGLFQADRLAQTYSTAEITKPFRYNGFYPEAYAPRIDPSTWRLEIAGDVASPGALSLSDLRRMQYEIQVTRLICIEGWSAVGEWGGVPLSAILTARGSDLSRRYVRLDCVDGYWTSIDMASALHPQTIMALDFLGRPLPVPFGAPARLRIPTKLGFKNAKFVTRVTVTDDFQSGYWEDQGYNWFAGL